MLDKINFNNNNIIHIAGTNGKGSTSYFIYNILQGLGYKCGMFVSPYVYDFKERIQFNGEYISGQELEKHFKKVLEISRQMDESPTEFEILTVLALSYFNDNDADFIILETGLGGRLDSTNAVKQKLVSIITTISTDHTDVLGNTTKKIAGEKAGIIQEGVGVISNVTDKDAKQIIAKTSYEKGAPLMDISKIKIVRSGKKFSFKLDGNNYADLEIQNTSESAFENAKTALSCIHFLRKKKLITSDKEKILKALLSTKIPARMEFVEDKFLFDGAHNEESISMLVKEVKSKFESKKVLIIFGVLKTKDVKTIIENLSEISNNFIIEDSFHEDSLSKEEVKEFFSSDVNTNRTYAEINDFDIVIVTGSFYLLKKVKEKIN